MPRTVPKETTTFASETVLAPTAIAEAPRSLVASAARIRGGNALLVQPHKTDSTSWHAEAWQHYRNIGEFRYSCDWIGGMLSKADIFATVETVDGVQRIKEGSILEYLSAFFGNKDGRAEMFRLIGIHMSVTGECYIVGYQDPDKFGDGGDKWEVAASTKVTRPATGSATDWWKVNDVTLVGVPVEEVTCIRIWRPDPENPQQSISPTLGVMSTLRQLERLTKFIDAQLDSRLAGAGILLMPDTMTLPPAPTKEGEEPPVRSANNAEELMGILMEAMKASLTNQAHASSKVPIVVTATAEAIAAVKHMTFWSELDAHASELRKEAIGRLALGMDVPPEVLQGASESNHWSAWQADESAIKAHAEPLLKMITTAIGSHYLRPLLSTDAAYAGERLSAYSVQADTSEMRLRPNRSKEAMELYNLGILSAAALLRECGFDTEDLMNKEELAKWLTQKIALGSTTPEMVEAANKELGVTLNIIRPEGEESEGTEGRPAPSLKDHPENNIPDPEKSADRKEAREEGRVPSADIERKAALLAAGDQIVVRALERAGNRLKTKAPGAKFAVPAVELHTVMAAQSVPDLLTDAWAHVPRVAERYGEEPIWLQTNLENYCSRIINGQRKHTWGEFTAYMEDAFKSEEKVPA